MKDYKLDKYMADFPKMSLSKTCQIVTAIGFNFFFINKKPVLMESVRIAASRHKYLRRVQSGYELFYTDKTWCSQNHTTEYVLEVLNQHNN